MSSAELERPLEVSPAQPDTAIARGWDRRSNGALLKALEITAPSKSEQQAIVTRIHAALTEIDAIENSSKAALDDINRLPSRVLAQAFAQ